MLTNKPLFDFGIAALIILVIFAYGKYRDRKREKEKQNKNQEIIGNSEFSLNQEQEDIGNEIETVKYIKSAYKQKWMFTMNEKDTFYKLEKIAKEQNMRIFAKVRLFDLVEPIKGHQKYKTNLYKIQAKHIDFVITKENLVATHIIELDDNSHNTAERKERDKLVDNVLTACGYKVLRIKGVQEETIKEFLSS